MPTKIVFSNEQAAQDFWAANEAPRESCNKHFTFSTDEYEDQNDDDDEYFSVASSECYPNDIPEFITIDLNDILVVTYKPRRGLKTTLKATRDALRKVVKPRTASSRPPSATKSLNKHMWFRKRQQKSRISPSSTGNDDVDVSKAIGNNS